MTSANLNTTELVWEDHDQKFRAKQLTNKAHLKLTLQEIWAELSSVYLQTLVERRATIYEVLIKANGDHFDESKV